MAISYLNRFSPELRQKKFRWIFSSAFFLYEMKQNIERNLFNMLEAHPDIIPRFNCAG